MSSEHLILFGAIARRHQEFNSIIEIGTYDGRSAIVLGKLFPKATVNTLDLPDLEPLTQHSGIIPRSADLLNARDLRLASAHNVHFFATNSLILSESSNFKQCDLVWVDGDHTYPVAAVDVANAVRLLKPGGYLVCDDVVTRTSLFQGPYLSSAGIDTVSAMNRCGLLSSPTFLRKRLGKWHQSPRRFVAVCRRLNTSSLPSIMDDADHRQEDREKM